MLFKNSLKSLNSIDCDLDIKGFSKQATLTKMRCFGFSRLDNIGS